MVPKVIELTEANFKENINYQGLFLVDFWAPWCSPCKIMGPIIEELAEEVSLKVKIGKLNIDENPNIANEYEIMGIPTLIIFKGGKAVDRLTGVHSKENITSILKEKES